MTGRLAFLFLTFFIATIAQLYGVENPSLTLDLSVNRFSLQEGTGNLSLIIHIPKGWKLTAPPGESDTLVYPPKLTWEDSQNLKDLKAEWPLGKVLRVDQEISHVYTQKVVVPLTVKAVTPGKAIHIKGTLEALTCSTVCLPQAIPFALTLSRAIDTQAVQERLEDQQELAQEQLSLPLILCFALLGGVLLNLMPCVLPVLGLKFVVFANQTNPCPRLMRQNFLLTAFGIMTSFGVLALLIVGLKAFNQAVGWGLHFQNPYFLAAMVVGLTFFMASFWGIYEFQAPLWMNRMLKTSGGSSSSWSAFISGALATLLATPCSAPFVGTAVGFALARNPLDIIAVFFLLSLGFCSPYLLALLVPERFLILPKPGMWMIYVQRVLGVVLACTIGWLLWLLSIHETQVQLFLTLLLLGIGLGGLWLGTKYPRLKVLSVIVLCTILVIPALKDRLFQNGARSHAQVSSDDLWKPFEPLSITPLVQAGKTVFVDVTADWCITCKMNKRVFQSSKIKNLLKTEQIMMMQADLTKPDPEILTFLKRFHKAAIPFNVVFSPRHPKGLVLPELLTEKNVWHALQ